MGSQLTALTSVKSQIRSNIEAKHPYVVSRSTYSQEQKI